MQGKLGYNIELIIRSQGEQTAFIRCNGSWYCERAGDTACLPFPPNVAFYMPAVSGANFLTYVAQFMFVAVPPFGLVVRGSSLCRR